MSCQDIRSLLQDPHAALPPSGAAHVRDCLSCQGLRASFARVDALLASEPAPAAPPALTALILAAVAERRARDLAWARRQVLLLVAAAALVAGLGLSLGWAPVDALTASARLEVDALLAEVSRTIDGLLARGEQAALGALPSPPLLVIALLAPALLVLDGWLCAPSRRSA